MSEEDQDLRELRNKYRRKGSEAGIESPSVTLDRFAAFMAYRESEGQHFSDHKTEEWAKRFKRREEFHYADGENKKLLLQQMAEDIDGTRGALTKEDIFGALERLRRGEETV